jgi:DNA-binding Xre family transcriptional regulator
MREAAGRTPLERFRIVNESKLLLWPEEAGISRSRFNKIRLSGEMNVETLARLVCAASTLLGRPVRASEIADLGEDEPVAELRRQYRNRKRKTYDTRADRLLNALGISSALLATTARLTRPTVHKLRRGKGTLRVSNLAAIVRALRQLTGVPVRAADLCDVGEADRQVKK